mmetsp:Transcript_14386/g.58603  ORF Transcript_14386/g.58603 Transcript_14386/m.58603 type:complete len:126 (+) Transcript_14386:1034-1411(+)
MAVAWPTFRDCKRNYWSDKSRFLESSLVGLHFYSAQGPGVDISVVDRIVTAARDIEKLGGVVDVISCPSFHLGLPAYYILAVSEASSNLARYDNIRFGTADSSRSEDFGDEVKRRILMVLLPLQR